MSTVIRQRRWWALVAVLIVVVMSTIQLGRWQFGRWEDRRLAADEVRAAQSASPLPLADVAATTTPGDIRYYPVLAEGEYEPEATVLIRNRPQDGRNGYLVVVPLLTDSGVLAVNRGWIPAGVTAAAPESVPDPPAGLVEVTGRVQLDEPPRTSADLPAGQALRLSSTVVGADALPGAYLDLIAEDPETEPAPKPPAAPGTGTGPHLLYAVQWWLFGVVAVVGFILLTRREIAEQSLDPHTDTV